MYKLLIVDDEEFEREGMAEFIPWETYDVEMVGTAWNGAEGLEKINKLHPDIVLTDIKMPIMNGIELIQETKKASLDVEFIVLSGYGDFEFTSKAMEYGIRHYILKPCDEEKIVGVLEKVKSEIDEKQRQKNTVAEYRNTVSKLLPRAREQVFRNLLLDREPLKEDYQTLLKEYGDIHKPVRLLAIRGERTADNLEQFIVENILGELLGGKEMLLSVAIQKDVLLLIEDRKLEVIEKAVRRVKREFRKIAGTEPGAAVSNVGSLDEAKKLYQQTQKIYQLGGARKEALLYYELFKEVETEISDLVDLERIQKAEDYGTILFEIYLALLKMEIRAYTVEQQTEVLRQVQQILYGVVTVETEAALEKAVPETASRIAEKMGVLNLNPDKEQQRIFQILAAVYQNISNISLSMRYLAKNVLFMNEDYLGRVFAKNQNQKFSAWLMETRIAIAVRLMQYDDTLKNAYIAELTGYSADGQYFSKAFRKVMGITPTEYRKELDKSGK